MQIVHFEHVNTIICMRMFQANQSIFALIQVKIPVVFCCCAVEIYIMIRTLTLQFQVLFFFGILGEHSSEMGLFRNLIA